MIKSLHIKTWLLIGAIALPTITGCSAKSSETTTSVSTEAATEAQSISEANTDANTENSSDADNVAGALEASTESATTTEDEDSDSILEANDDLNNANDADNDLADANSDDTPISDDSASDAVDDISADSSEEKTEPLAPYVDYAANYNSDLVAQYSSDGDIDGLLNADFSADTDISYSAGESVDWAYSHNKRKYAVGECYVRLSSTPITKHWWGKEKKFNVYYIFTGTENCDVEISSGTATKVETDDENTIIYQKTLSPLKAKKAEAQTTIFKLTPAGQGSLRVDVIYDDSVDAINDDSSTIDFKE